ncbi:hypothetical protein [Luteolibacter luteus]|uniref:Uncharacterized protein n=1 Tax=Luteolibacter luteus TaxID=2728835 RepID=A0A858RC49_9BACT|nr:hypothetical protein [Luteolibacter luteus]QJE94265.1 hypothetical protein HHL09_00180 [Luteolibacter luteus]
MVRTVTIGLYPGYAANIFDNLKFSGAVSSIQILQPEAIAAFHANRI